ncbi:MAG: sigma-54 dependent transcriptional regulator, partial [Myxococcales bacterium]|nr:sigma-54 dependent transcriptional regulator [Myxococcales bacterium]
MKTADSSDALRRELSRRPFDLIVIERSYLADFSPELIAEVRGVPEAPAIVVLTDSDDPTQQAELLAAGCLAVLSVGADEDALCSSFRTLAERRLAESQADLRAIPNEDHGLADYATSSPAMRLFLKSARRIASRDCTVLLLGETGVGKGLLARSLHNEGPRYQTPFVAVNCGALTESLLESELFGHEKGAFTGADRSRRGHFELAHGGTLFLDEVTELPFHLQAKLLQALEDRKVQPLGSERTVDIDVRLIAATNRDLAVEVAEKRFRSDLYYRLNVVSLTLPSLRERKEDIPEIAQSYIDHFRARMAIDVKGIQSEAIQALLAYPWPGNVRELSNAIERAVIMTTQAEVQVQDLPVEIQELAPRVLGDLTAESARDADPSWLAKSWSEVRREVLEEAELGYLTALLNETQGRVGDAAERAGMDPRSLH